VKLELCCNLRFEKTIQVGFQNSKYWELRLGRDEVKTLVLFEYSAVNYLKIRHERTSIGHLFVIAADAHLHTKRLALNGIATHLSKL
jgi:hypothetical protein